MKCNIIGIDSRIVGPFSIWKSIPEDTLLVIDDPSDIGHYNGDVVYRPVGMDVLVNLSSGGGWSGTSSPPPFRFRVAPKGSTVTLTQE